jgi:hypothetical protein
MEQSPQERALRQLELWSDEAAAGKAERTETTGGNGFTKSNEETEILMA